jgi:putative monooxygenase
MPTTRASTTKVAHRDIPPNRRRGGDIRVLLGPATVGATSGFLGVLTLAPGEYVSEHYHPYSEEFLYVVSGDVIVRIDGEDIALTASEAVLVPIGARHRVTSASDGESVLTFQLGPLAPEPHLGHVDTEEMPGSGPALSVGAVVSVGTVGTVGTVAP